MLFLLIMFITNNYNEINFSIMLLYQRTLQKSVLNNF